jgi:hypothetical protein
VDTTLDPTNCGACGNRCGPTSTCRGGICGPPVTNFAPPAPECVSLNLATDGGTLYWTNQGNGTVNSQPLDGCAATTIATGENAPTRLTTDGANLFWVAGTTTTATIRALALPAGQPRDLVTETNTTGGILGLVLSADGRTLYYSADTRVRAVPVAGGAPFDVGREERGGIPTALAREGDTIAFVTGFNGNVDAITVQDGVVASCGGSDANGNLLMTNCRRSPGCNPGAFLGGLVLRGDWVFWADDLQIVGAPLEPPSWKNVVAWGDSDGGLGGLAGGPDALYFASNSKDGAIVSRAPYTAGWTTVADIARGQRGPSSLVVAGAHVYWATADCAINRAAR